MSLHLDAPAGGYADAILLPGDPLRSRFIAETFLDDVVRVNERRAAYGYTGRYRGRPLSVQATGMGIPSTAIYVHELIVDYGVRTLVRVGTCGSIHRDLKLGDIILAQTASTDSNLNKEVFRGMDFAPGADFGLLKDAFEIAGEHGQAVRVGGVMSSDIFYKPEDAWTVWADHGVLAVEMEAAALYTLAARFRARALAVLTVSDEIMTGAKMAPADRERALDAMVRIAMEAATREAR